MSLPQLKFWWEWRAASPFWPADEAACLKFGYGEIDPILLGLPQDLVQEIESIAKWHDTSLNWTYPIDPGPWRQEECDRFNLASHFLFEQVQKILAGKFEILYLHHEEKEDPDLDEYLVAPSLFRRKEK